MAAFTINRQELNILLNLMIPFVKKNSKIDAKEIILNVSFDKMKLKMSVPECTMDSECVATGKGKFSIQFMYFYGIIKLTEDETITISSKDNKITIFQKKFKIIP